MLHRAAGEQWKEAGILELPGGSLVKQPRRVNVGEAQSATSFCSSVGYPMMLEQSKRPDKGEVVWSSVAHTKKIVPEICRRMAVEKASGADSAQAAASMRSCHSFPEPFRGYHRIMPRGRILGIDLEHRPHRSSSGINVLRP